MRIAILDSFTADQNELLWTDLHTLGEVRPFARTSPTQVLERAAGCETILTNKVVIDANTIAALTAPTAERRLQYIGVMATGTNIVDLAAAKAHNVVVTNVPGYSTESVAQLVFALLLQLTHDVGGHNNAAKNGAWASSPDFCFFTQRLTELAGKNLVIIGMGAIGGAVARIGTAFGMNVIAAATPGSSTPGRMPLAEAIAVADVISLHCPLTPATKGLTNDAFLTGMKRGAILINTGRGPLLDDHAVVRALSDGRLGGLAIDVLTTEPPSAGHPLLDSTTPWAKRVVVTPHIAWGTVEARQRLIRCVGANLASFIAGKPTNRVA
jgi:glycerate dehydrogenase